MSKKITDILTELNLPVVAEVHAYEVAHELRDDWDVCVVAALHDVVEDGYMSLSELRDKFQLSPAQVKAIDALTRRSDEPYFSYINRCKRNKIAHKVKLEDLRHNIRRCSRDLDNYCGLLVRYAKAYDKLRNPGKLQNNE